ncbi:ABC transporter substrate-binding protein [Actinomyces bowdenii]|uniref:ABC transporter substrate-binding protein n=1 Tax=Actinomyces bowdenii TaxID=131109 RepID=A0A853ERI1_9ACTO|nr:ABC transporter substrate-binding protein [Actinomyces bowdenii]MBF0698104.1 ABC transporter substrate-binding protein [Actinomyces bowdenii]MDO5064110.1 ABC transporter substrate-binding protein [Actinomyces bowdenii]NYS70276.1 ABC transporter substrate-binding protein [Actinomyces bowdenii]
MSDKPTALSLTTAVRLAHPTASRRLFLGAGMSALGSLALAACGANSATSSSSGTATAGGTLRILTSETDLNWDPAKSQSMPMTSLALVHRRLTTWSLAPGKPVELVPDLATDTGTVSSDGLSWTFTLKKGLVLSDGTPLTSAHIKHGVERSFAPALAGGLTYHKALLAGAQDYEGPYEGKHLDSIQTPDDSTIVFQLTRAFGDWPWIVAQGAFAPVPQGDDPATYTASPIASGPYVVAQAAQGSSVTLERNPHWSADTDQVRLALPDSIVFELSQDESTASQRLIADSGQDRTAFGADRVSAAQLAQVTANPAAKDRLATTPDGGPATYLAINVERVTDPQVRQAIAHAVDKAAVVAALGGELGAVSASTLITPGIPGRQDYDLYPTDPGKAASLLEGKEVPSLVLLTQNSAAHQAVAQAVEQSLKEAGLSVTIDPQTSEAFNERATQGDGSTYDLAIASWNPDYPSANANIQPLFASSEIGKGGHNISRYSNEKVDAAIAEAAANLDTEAARSQWAELDRAIAQDVPVVPLAFRRNSFLRGSGVQGFFVDSYPAYPSYQVVGVSGS